jgi:amino acid adenylation domain-containing protein
MDIPEIQAIYTLSPIQKSLFFESGESLKPNRECLSISCLIEGVVDHVLLGNVSQDVVNDRPELRTSFVWKKTEQPFQIVHRQVTVALERIDLGHQAADIQELSILASIRKDLETGLDPARPPLLRLKLYQKGEQSYRLHLYSHCLAVDDTSLRLVLGEILVRYEDSLAGRRREQDHKLSFEDYIAWLKGQDLKDAAAHWRSVLEDIPAPTLPGLRRGGVVTVAAERFAALAYRVPEEVASGLRSLCEKHDLTLSACTQAAWAALLSRYSGNSRIRFGIRVSTRPSHFQTASDLIGPYTTSTPLVVSVTPDGSHLTLIHDVDERRKTASACAAAFGGTKEGTGRDFSEWAEEGPEREDALRQIERLNGGTLRVSDVRSCSANEPALYLKLRSGDELVVVASYDRSQVEDDSVVSRMLEQFGNLLRSGARDPDRRIYDASFLSDEECRRLLIEWVGATAPRSFNGTIQEAFEERVAASPDRTSLVFTDEHETIHLSSRCLNGRANRLARSLTRIGVGPESPVGICLSRSIDSIVVILAVLKAGGAFVSLDPNYPVDRLVYMLENARAGVLLAEPRLADTLGSHCPRVIPVHRVPASDGVAHDPEARGDRDSPGLYEERLAEESEDDLVCASGADNLAYIMYTSGSTGRPKGVCVPHRSLCNLVERQIDIFDIGEHSRVLQFASMSFDASVSEVFTALIAGATLCLSDRGSMLPGKTLSDLMRHEQITVVTLPPSALAVTPDASLPALATVVSAGEACPAPTANRWAGVCKFINAYGPTETTVCATAGAHSPSDQAPPIGRPIGNLTVYVLDSVMRAVPTGAAGEMYIGGAGVARGYAQAAEITAERFVPDPFSERPGARLYRSGDRVRYLPEGDIEFLGRTDQQLKIRGFRVEPGEIESALASHPGVLEALVVGRGESPELQKLVAYVVLKEAPGVETMSEGKAAAQLHQFLAARLPAHLLPSTIVFLREFPKSPNGKTDLSLLPAPESLTAKDIVPPRDLTEYQLLQIWKEAIGSENIGVRDNFFQIGGHSLLAVRLMAQIQRVLGIDLPVSTLFTHGTIEEMAALIRRTDRTQGVSPSVSIQPKGDKPPIFLAHPAGGTVLCYFELAKRLAPDYPIYGLQSLGLTAHHQPEADLERMAASYNEAVRAIQPAGPYNFGGVSMGGILAYEMARQMAAAGERIALLALFDTNAEAALNTAASPDEDELALVVSLMPPVISLSVEDLERLDEESRLVLILERLKAASLVPFDFDIDQVRRYVDVMRTNIRSMRSYVPRSYPGKITLFLASQSNSSGDRAKGWGALGLGGVEVIDVPGNHGTMLAEPHVSKLAETLKACLDLSVSTKAIGQPSQGIRS